MPTTDQDRAAEILGPTDCRLLLATARIGRLGFTRDALPAIRPVSFRLHEEQVVIPVRRGSRLVPGTRGAVVAFEADSFDEDTRTGWSVTVVGPSRPVVAGAELAVLDALPWAAPAAAPDRCYIRVAMGVVRGWRTVPGPAPP